MVTARLLLAFSCCLVVRLSVPAETTPPAVQVLRAATDGQGLQVAVVVPMPDFAQVVVYRHGSVEARSAESDFALSAHQGAGWVEQVEPVCDPDGGIRVPPARGRVFVRDGRILQRHALADFIAFSDDYVRGP
jgi:hypothetical protein